MLRRGCGFSSPAATIPSGYPRCATRQQIFRLQSSKEKKAAEDELASCRRTSPLGIQMLSKPLYKQIFPHEDLNKGSDSIVSQKINQSISHLKGQDLWCRECTSLPDVDIQLPPLMGKNLDDHFRTIARDQSQLYLDLAIKLIHTKLPPLPTKWSWETGWTLYHAKTGQTEKVECPQDDALVLDVETCVLEGKRPILAVAVSPQAWYSWVSERLSSSEDFFSNMERDASLDDLIQLEKGCEDVNDPSSVKWDCRLVVGHNVSYDRARLKEQYLIKGPKTKFLDTLSLHTCVAGQTSHQKGIWTSRKKKLKEIDLKEDEDSFKRKMNMPTSDVISKPRNLWMEVSSPGNLADVHWLHVRRGQKRIDKRQREVFVKGTVQDIRNDFQNLMGYCAEDVLCTYEVLKKVLPMFLMRCPHPVTFAGMLEMGSAYLPLNSNWKEYITDAEYVYEDMKQEMKAKLMALANSACSYLHDKRYMKSPWLCNLNWTSKKFRGKAITKKSDKIKLLTAIEDFYEKQENEFLENTGESGGKEKAEFIISSMESKIPQRAVHMPGYPEWYRVQCMKRNYENQKLGPINITAQTRITPYLLRMKWKGHPLHYHANLGWGYIISPDLPEGETPTFDGDDDVDLGMECLHVDPEMSLEQVDDLIDKDSGEVVIAEDPRTDKEEEKRTSKVLGVRKKDNDKNSVLLSGSDISEQKVISTVWGVTDDIVTLGDKSYYFFKIPHKDGSEANCGNPLSKDYLSKMEDGTLTSAAGQLGQRILILNSMISFWRSARNRILDQFVVNLQQKAANGSAEQFAILPQLRVAGTVTRRAVEPTWLTASNAKEGRVGSELKASVRVPPGYHLVGADVDSQELWIAAVLGDMYFTGLHGSTGVGWMTLQGSKHEGTDVHSNTARTIGISRDHAKILNYGRIYGAGQPFIKLLLRNFNPSLSSREVEEKAQTLFVATKGKRVYKLNNKGQDLAKDMEMPMDSGCIGYEDWKILCSTVGYFKAMDYLSERLWSGGSESHLFNKLESIALSELPRTPVLGCCISMGLEPKYVGAAYQPSKVNWVVQSSAVDYLHLMLVCTNWLFERYNIDGRFCISIHDEVRYLVKSEDRYRAGLALQLANLFTRAMFAYQLKMYDLPQSVAFFSAVDIDKVLRKEPGMDCNTPSNPLGLEKGQGIPPGEALDIYQLLEKTNCSLNK